MFSCAHWQSFCMYAHADDGFGNPIRLNTEEWRAAWLFTYTEDLGGSASNSYPIIRDWG